MTYECEPISIDDARAQAAERLLERKRMGLESAVEALEAVGYRVVHRDDGTYAVRPPYVRPEPTTKNPSDTPSSVADDFLADYPPTLTVRDVSEITGLHVGSVRRLLSRGELPHAKVGGRLLIPKSEFVALFREGHLC